jgi:hypothetical protein
VGIAGECPGRAFSKPKRVGAPDIIAGIWLPKGAAEASLIDSSIACGAALTAKINGARSVNERVNADTPEEVQLLSHISQWLRNGSTPGLRR